MKNLKLDGVKLIQKTNEQKTREERARAYSRSCRIKKAKVRTTMEIIGGAFVMTAGLWAWGVLLIGFLG